MQYYKSRKDNQLLAEAYKTEVAAQPLEEGTMEFNPAKFTKEMQGLTKYISINDNREMILSRGGFLGIKGILQKYYMDPSARKQAMEIASRVFPHLDGESQEMLEKLILARTLAADDKWESQNQPFGGETVESDTKIPGTAFSDIKVPGNNENRRPEHRGGVTVRNNYGV